MLNSSFIIGYVSAPPILSRDHNDKLKALFVVSTRREYSSSTGEIKTETVSARIQAFGKLAQLVEATALENSLVLIKGRLTNESKHSSNLIVTAEHLNFGISKTEAQKLSE